MRRDLLLAFTTISPHTSVELHIATAALIVDYMGREHTNDSAGCCVKTEELKEVQTPSCRTSQEKNHFSFRRVHTIHTENLGLLSFAPQNRFRFRQFEWIIFADAVVSNFVS
jgi:hypothetical protein